MGLNDQLEAFWKLDEASGSRLDSSGNGRTLTDNNSVGQVAGKIGNAAQFNAASSRYLSAADAAWCSFGNESFTVAGWIYLDSAGAEAAVLGKNTEWRCTITTGRRPRLVLPSTSLSWSTALSLSTWYHVVWQYDAAADLIRISVNNATPETVADSNGATDGTNELRVGRQGTAYFDGRIDALGLWRRALSSTEIAQLYNSGSGIEPPFATAYTLTLSETLTGSDSLTKATSRALAEATTAADSISKGAVRTCTEAPSLADTITRDIARELAETATALDSITRDIARALAESSTLADAITRDLARSVAETLGTSDSLSKAIAREVVDAVAAADGDVYAISRILTDSLSLSDSIVAELIVLFGRIARPRVALLSPLRTVAQVSPIRTVELS